MNAEMNERMNAGSAQDQSQREKLKVERPLGENVGSYWHKKEKKE